MFAADVLSSIFTVLFWTRGVVPLEVARDGNCFLVAVAVGLVALGFKLPNEGWGNAASDALRRAVHGYLVAHEAELQHTWCLSDKEWEQFLSDLAQNGRWRRVEQDLVLHVLTQLYPRVRFVLYDTARKERALEPYV